MQAFDTEKTLDARRELEAVVEGVPEDGYADVVSQARDAIRLIDEAFRVPEQAETALGEATRRVRDLRTMTADGPGNVHATRAGDILDEVAVTAS